MVSHEPSNCHKFVYCCCSFLFLLFLFFFLEQLARGGCFAGFFPNVECFGVDSERDGLLLKETGEARIFNLLIRLKVNATILNRREMTKNCAQVNVTCFERVL